MRRRWRRLRKSEMRPLPRWRRVPRAPLCGAWTPPSSTSRKASRPFSVWSARSGPRCPTSRWVRRTGLCGTTELRRNTARPRPSLPSLARAHPRRADHVRCHVPPECARDPVRCAERREELPEHGHLLADRPDPPIQHPRRRRRPHPPGLPHAHPRTARYVSSCASVQTLRVGPGGAGGRGRERRDAYAFLVATQDTGRARSSRGSRAASRRTRSRARCAV